MGILWYFKLQLKNIIVLCYLLEQWNKKDLKNLKIFRFPKFCKDFSCGNKSFENPSGNNSQYRLHVYNLQLWKISRSLLPKGRTKRGLSHFFPVFFFIFFYYFHPSYPVWYMWVACVHDSRLWNQIRGRISAGKTGAETVRTALLTRRKPTRNNDSAWKFSQWGISGCTGFHNKI